MRAGIAATLMGIGGVFLAFGTVVVVLALFARNGDTRLQLPAMGTVATGSLVIGAAMFGAGFLLGRIGRDSSPSTPVRNS